MAVTGAGHGTHLFAHPRETGALHGISEALAATMIVTALPVAVVWTLRARGIVRSPVVEILLAIAISLAVGWAGEVLWARHRHADGALFSELLLWGWLRRRRNEQRLAHADLLLAELVRPPTGQARRASERLLRQLAAAIDAQDAYLDGHSRRVARHATMIAREMGLPRREVARIRAAAAVHDVGKLSVPLTVLDKPGPLTTEEFELIKRHPTDGEAIVARLEDAKLSAIVRHHHERFDGGGYPDGVAGEAIPLGARIVAVADTFDAITSTRAYRPAVPHRQALDVLRDVAGTQLEPRAVHAFLRHYGGRRPIALWTSLTAILSEAARRTGLSAPASPLFSAKTVVLVAASAAIGSGGLALVPAIGGPHAVPGAVRGAGVSASSASDAGLAALPLPLTETLAGAAVPRSATRRHHHAGTLRRRHGADRRHAAAPRQVAAVRAHRAARYSGTTAYLAPSHTTRPVHRPSSHGGGSSSSGASQGGGGSASTTTTAPSGGSSGSGSGGPGSQGLAHGNGPNGTGPPGLTGQNPGQSGAPPPGQAKKSH